MGDKGAVTPGQARDGVDLRRFDGLFQGPLGPEAESGSVSGGCFHLELKYIRPIVLLDTS